MFPDLHKFNELAYDTETTGLSHLKSSVFSFSVSTPDGVDYYWDLRRTPKAKEWFNSQMKDYKGTIICHNLSFDYRMSMMSGLYFPLCQSVDTVVLACLINEHEHNYTLENLSKKYCGNTKKGAELYRKLADLFGGLATANVQMPRLPQAPFEIVEEYAKADTRATYELYQWQKKAIERQGIQKIVAFEQQLTPILIKSELHGIRVDIDQAHEAIEEITKVINIRQNELNQIAGFTCNPQPSSDTQKLFKPRYINGNWFADEDTLLLTTDSGNACLDTAALRRIKHPAANVILELRSLLKTRDTFLKGHIIKSAVGGRVYSTINQCKGDSGGTSTGRLSYRSPALQQIPDRDKDVARIVKSIFLPNEECSWVDADLASFEVRIFAHLVGTEDIQQAYFDNPETDFHQLVADMTGLVRNATYAGQPNAKQLNLSMIFNQGNGQTADIMGMDWTWETFTPKGQTKSITYKKAGYEAMKIINRYHHALSGVKALADGCKATALRRGYLFTRRGRHLHFPDKNKTYKASGLLIQATSADENKQNWIVINEAIAGTGAKLLLNTHDSYSLSIPKGQEDIVSKRVKEAVEEDRGLKVPLILEVQHSGSNWWESKSSKRKF